MKWVKSSFSEASGNSCVEIAQNGYSIVIRDFKNPKLPSVTACRAAWSRFTNAVANERVS
ncbi:DUF397 domain-containing protein [Streptomyces sp. NBC_01352]|uniref:DUF397 domain-containing protein n=1 Tax=Streptomyces sp. NBC_01352 TaxID=2903834 RepID=UPI002E33E17D|nr:DUF397 domain-containing protein [Streptomyces sp. NBC_01352]